MCIDEIYNFVRVSDDIATSGQPTADQFRALAEEGFSTVVNLAPEYSFSLPDEGKLVTSLGMRYVHIPVDWENPRASDFSTFEQEMLVSPAPKTLIHCVANYRVTAFYSLYALKHHGWSESRADAFRTAIWKDSDNPVWEAFIADLKTKIIAAK